jgi:aspartate 1-decarboxylase
MYLGGVTMLRMMFKSKIHRATVTEADLNYVGSITIDEELMEKADILEAERVQVLNINNGERLETYVLTGERGSGIICLNGAAARKFLKGDKVIIISYGFYDQEELKEIQPVVIHVDDDNRIV